MRLLFLTRLYFPHVGGVELPVKNLAETLTKKGHRVTVITEKFSRDLKDRETINGVKIIRIRYLKIRFFGLISIWLWLLFHLRYLYSNELIHVHDVFIWYLPFRLLFLRKPVYTTFHGWEGVSPIPKKNIYLKKAAAFFSKGTLAVGDFIAKHYGIEVNDVTYGATDFTAKSVILAQKKPKSIVYLGRLEKDTGLPIFLKVLAILARDKKQKYTVDFCGDGSLRKSCEKYGRVHGFVDPRAYLHKAKICFASGYYSILEAFAQKCLVFGAYDNPLKKDYFSLAPFCKWLVFGNSPQYLVDSLKDLEENPSKARFLIDKSYIWAKNQTWQALTEKYLKIWNLK